MFVDQESSRDAGDAVELSGFVLPTFEVGELGPLETHASDGTSPGFLAIVEAHTHDFQPLAVEVGIEFLHIEASLCGKVHTMMPRSQRG